MNRILLLPLLAIGPTTAWLTFHHLMAWETTLFLVVGDWALAATASRLFVALAMAISVAALVALMRPILPAAVHRILRIIAPVLALAIGSVLILPEPGKTPSDWEILPAEAAGHVVGELGADPGLHVLVSTGCPHCQELARRLSRLDLASLRPVSLVFAETQSGRADFLDELHGPIPIRLLPKQTFVELTGMRFPTILLIEDDGTIRRTHGTAFGTRAHQRLLTH